VPWVIDLATENYRTCKAWVAKFAMRGFAASHGRELADSTSVMSWRIFRGMTGRETGG